MSVTQATQAAEKLGEEDLVRMARARDEAAVRAITKRYNRRLFRIARSILRNDAEAEDVVQETYVRAFTGLDMFRGDALRNMDYAHRHERGSRAAAATAAYGGLGDIWHQPQRSRDHQFSDLGGGQRSGEGNGAERNPCGT